MSWNIRATLERLPVSEKKGVGKGIFEAPRPVQGVLLGAEENIRRLRNKVGRDLQAPDPLPHDPRQEPGGPLAGKDRSPSQPRPLGVGFKAFQAEAGRIHPHHIQGGHPVLGPELDPRARRGFGHPVVADHRTAGALQKGLEFGIVLGPDQDLVLDEEMDQAAGALGGRQGLPRPHLGARGQGGVYGVAEGLVWLRVLFPTGHQGEQGQPKA
jgi:hypothetical protein